MKAKPLYSKVFLFLCTLSVFFAQAETIVITGDISLTDPEFSWVDGDDLIVENGARFTINGGEIITANSISLYGGQLMMENGSAANVVDGIEMDYGGSLNIESATLVGDIFSFLAGDVVISNSSVEGSVHLGGVVSAHLSNNAFISTEVKVAGGSGEVSIANNEFITGLSVHDVGGFTVANNRLLGGRLSIDDSGEGFIDENILVDGDLVVIDNDSAAVTNNVVTGMIRVEDTGGDTAIIGNSGDTIKSLDNQDVLISGNTAATIEVIGSSTGECAIEENITEELLKDDRCFLVGEVDEPGNRQYENLPEFMTVLVNMMEELDFSQEEISIEIDALNILLHRGLTEEEVSSIVDKLVEYLQAQSSETEIDAV